MLIVLNGNPEISEYFSFSQKLPDQPPPSTSTPTCVSVEPVKSITLIS